MLCIDNLTRWLYATSTPYFPLMICLTSFKESLVSLRSTFILDIHSWKWRNPFDIPTLQEKCLLVDFFALDPMQVSLNGTKKIEIGEKN